MEPVTLAFGLFLLLVSAGLTVCHLGSRKKFGGSKGETKELNYLRNRFRRRMQASAMIGIVGIAILVGQWIPSDTMVIYICYWAGVVLFVFWIMLLAMADIVTSRMYYSQLHREQIVEQAQLRAKLQQRIQQRNGHDPETERVATGESDS